MSGELDIVDILEAELARLLEWSRAADQRIRFTTPLSTAMLGTLGILGANLSSWSNFQALTSVAAAFPLALSVAFSAFATFPRTTRPDGSLIYFGGISSLGLKRCEEAILSLSREAYTQDLISQCHRNAQIVCVKYRWIQRSLFCLFVSAVPWSVSLFIL